MDAALTLACGLAAEERVARKGGARTARVGLGAGLPLPDGRLVSFGLAGALVPGIEPGTLLTAERIVSERGEILWEGEPLAVAGARPAVICASTRVVDASDERRTLAARTGAVAADMESARLAATGRLAGAVRAVSDTPERPVGSLAYAARPDGRTDWGVVVRAFVREPVQALRAARAALRAFAALERAAVVLR